MRLLVPRVFGDRAADYQAVQEGVPLRMYSQRAKGGGNLSCPYVRLVAPDHAKAQDSLAAMTARQATQPAAVGAAPEESCDEE